ncbi:MULTISPECIES: hypothetical protein [Chryseobacterium]|uniref:hypothetical protein n=1 Tax=Chryseobacterium TaxID=59732 RepID=UPI0012957C30|nr:MULTISPECIES: hypothetical protein [Chryseobacterium]MDR6919564.1 hypothetical protein [Chryseobacterium sp. 2987]
MKNILIFLITTLMTNVKGQVIIGSSSSSGSAVLEVVSANKGMLIPRLDIPDFDNPNPVTNPADMLIAMNTNTSSGTGLVYWDASAPKQSNPSLTGRWELLYELSTIIKDISTNARRVYLVSLQTSTAAFNPNVEVQTLMQSNTVLQGSISGNIYTVPETGIYEINARVSTFQGTTSSDGYLEGRIKVNGTVVKVGRANKNSGAPNSSAEMVHRLSLIAGDQVSYYFFQSIPTGTGTTQNRRASQISVTRLDPL